MSEQQPTLTERQEQHAVYPAYLGSMAKFAASLDEWYKPRTDNDGTVFTTVQQIHHDLTRPSQWLLDLGTPDDLDLSELHYFTGNAGQDGRTKLAQASMSAVFKANLITSQEFRQLQVQGRAALQSLQSQIGDLWTGEAPLDLECQALFLINYALVRHELGIAPDAIPDSKTASRLNHACLAMTLVAGRIIARTAGEGRYPALFALPDQSHPLHLHDTVIGQALGYLENRIFISKSMSYISPWERIGEKQINNLSEVLQHIAEMAGIKGRGDMNWPKVKKWLDSLTEAAEEYAIALRTAQEETSGARLQAGVRQQELEEGIAKEREALRQQVQQLEAQLQSREARAAAAPETDWGAMVVKALKHAGPEQIAQILAQATGKSQTDILSQITSSTPAGFALIAEQFARAKYPDNPAMAERAALLMQNSPEAMTARDAWGLERTDLAYFLRLFLQQKQHPAQPWSTIPRDIDCRQRHGTGWISKVGPVGLRIRYPGLDLRVRRTKKGEWQIFDLSSRNPLRRLIPARRHLEQVMLSRLKTKAVQGQQEKQITLHFLGPYLAVDFPPKIEPGDPLFISIDAYRAWDFLRLPRQLPPVQAEKKTIPEPEKLPRVTGMEVVCLTNPGLIREINEDNYAAEKISEKTRKYGQLILVADGMGGRNAGEVASDMGAKAISDHFYLDTGTNRAQALVNAITSANKRIYDSSQNDENRKGMGTTVTAAVLIAGKLIVANVGDSRAYLIGQTGIRQVTKDHSWVQEQVDAGLMTRAQAKKSQQRHLIIRSLGSKESVNIDTYTISVVPGDVLLLCTDGLHDELDEPEILATINTHRQDINQAVQALIDAANEKGGRDNITAVLARMT